MILERIESEGLTHYSYLVGDQNDAVVIDPRRDCQVYLERANRAGMKISHILETHRNEDYVAGSAELAARSGALIWHADRELDYGYGSPVEAGQAWRVGRLSLEAVFTPGHTLGSFSYLLREAGGSPWAIFTGDALFAGDVGRVDLLGMERAEEMAGLLYRSIFERILPLGDGVLVCPAHGTGSVCGTAISDRPWTTVGLERRLNPRLQVRSEAEFVAGVSRELERPPYFRQMEEINLKGAPLPDTFPQPLSPEEFSERAKTSLVVDTRMELGYGAAHVPGSQFIWMGGLASLAGWYLPHYRPILLVNETDDVKEAFDKLVRLGYDRVAGYLAGGMLAWHMAGEESASLETLTVQKLCRRLDLGEEGEAEEKAWILDVRSEEELARAKIDGAHHIHVTQIPARLDEVPKDKKVYVFCGSGLRSMVAASLLEQRGYRDLAVVLGGLSGWRSKTCPLVV